MKSIYTLVSTFFVALALFGAPALASAHMSSEKRDAGLHLGWFLGVGNDRHGEDSDDEKEEKKKELRADVRGIIGVVTRVDGSTLTLATGKGAIISVDASDASWKGATLASVENDVVAVRGERDDDTIEASSIVSITGLKDEWREKASHTKTGIVTDIDGMKFSIEPLGLEEGITVTTNANTVYKLDGKTASSSALGVGANVRLTGTSTGETAFSASLVEIFTKSIGRMKGWFTFR